MFLFSLTTFLVVLRFSSADIEGLTNRNSDKLGIFQISNANGQNILTESTSTSSLDGNFKGQFEINRNCCLRRKRMKEIGTNFNGESIRVDVGYCPKRCQASEVIKRKEFEEIWKQNPDTDPRQLFLHHNWRRREPSCHSGHICVNSNTRVERIHTTEGEVKVNIVEDCSCQPSSKLCQRQPKIVTFYKGQPLETSIDVGLCVGHCSEDTKCRPTVSKTTSIDGPNGAECVNVVEDCSCQSSCHRLSHYEQFYDYRNNTSLVKVIDVGKCGGKCEEERKEKCVIRDYTGDNCLMSIYSRSVHCGPIRQENVSITDKDGQQKNISTISECRCH